MNKRVYLRQAILDLSKIVMYEFHYDYMKPKYGTNFQMHYTNTDSLIYDLKTDDFYEDSNYSPSQVRLLPMGVNKVIGLMKDELGRRVTAKFVALRPKLYMYKTLSGSGNKKFKGVKKCIVKKMLHFDDYKQCLLAG